MDRLESVFQTVAAQRRDQILHDCNTGVSDSDLPPEERPNRAEVAPNCLLKFGDDILSNGVPGRYLCPGRGIGWAYVLTIEESGFTLGSFDAYSVTDRAPADPAETPMPIFAEPPP